MGLLAGYFYAQRSKLNALKARMKDAQERAIAKASLEIQDKTLKTIALDLHDDVGQILSALRLNLRGLGDTLDIKQNEQFKNSLSLLDLSLGKIRYLSNYLYQVDTFKLLPAIEKELARIKSANVLQTQFSVNGATFHENSSKFDDVPAQAGILLFRVFQEALANTLKHAEAKSIMVKVYTTADRFLMEISDDGVGFSTESQRGLSRGLGLKSMYERIRLLSGQIEIKSTNAGTVIKLEVPFNSSVDDGK